MLASGRTLASCWRPQHAAWAGCLGGLVWTSPKILLCLGWLACCALPWLELAWACLACLALAWSSNNNSRGEAAAVDRPRPSQAKARHNRQASQAKARFWSPKMWFLHRKTLQSHQKCHETGPGGSVWADIWIGWFPLAMGSLWHTSWPLKHPKD